MIHKVAIDILINQRALLVEKENTALVSKWHSENEEVFKGALWDHGRELLQRTANEYAEQIEAIDLSISVLELRG